MVKRLEVGINCQFFGSSSILVWEVTRKDPCHGLHKHPSINNLEKAEMTKHTYDMTKLTDDTKAAEIQADREGLLKVFTALCV